MVSGEPYTCNASCWRVVLPGLRRLWVGWWPGGNTFLPFDAPGSQFISIAAGDNHSLALRPDGTVVAWGANSAGQALVPVGMSNVVAVSAGQQYNLVLKNDGSVEGWGGVTIPAGLSNVVAVSAGAGHCLALNADGTVAAWGNNSVGQTNVPVALAERGFTG